MTELIIKAVTKHGNPIMRFDDMFCQMAYDYMIIFDNLRDIRSKTIEIIRIQKKTEEFVIKLNNFVTKYEKNNPKVHKLRQHFEKLQIGEHFLIFNDDNELSFEELKSLYIEIDVLNEGVDYNEELRKHDEIFGRTLSNYTVIARDNQKKLFLGEPDKHKRVCRYCGESILTGATFKSKAHTISEALGNSTLFQNEECDKCNTFFDREVERDFIRFLDVYRVFFQVRKKGNNKIPTLKGKNFEIRNIDEENFAILRYATDVEIEEDQLGINDGDYITNELISNQNIYKCLVKFAIGIVDRKDLSFFTNTIDWLSAKISTSKLPKVGMISSYEMFYEEPNMIVYLRKSSDESLPAAIGEFHFKFFTFIFIIPIFDGSEDYFVENNFKNILEVFPYFNAGNDLVLKDFSNSEKKNLVYQLNFEVNNGNESS